MQYLTRYGLFPEVARCEGDPGLERGAEVVLETHRGLQYGAILEAPRTFVEPSPTHAAADEPTASEASPFRVLRAALESDRSRFEELRAQARSEFARWEQRIRDWNLDLQLIDLEWTLDSAKVILYVLNERGPECTKLAIQAAAAGLGIVEVQPVSRDGLVSQPQETKGGGCGSCGCHN